MLEIITKIMAIIMILGSHIAEPAEIPETPVPHINCECIVVERADKPATYPSCGIVYALEYADDAVVVVTPDGELWEFYGCEDWAIGDICAMTFADAGIPNYIWDDEIIETKYVGYVPDWE